MKQQKTIMSRFDKYECVEEIEMLTTEPTPEMIKEWQQIFEKHHASMRPNRRAGRELDAYFRSKYAYQRFNDPKFKRVVELNIQENGCFGSKRHGKANPEVQCYCVGEVVVGIDLTSGEFHVECEDIQKTIPIYDDLFVYRGLDKFDLENYFLVAQYVILTQLESQRKN